MIRLGCIADDFTGATDLANNLVRAGMRVAQTMGVPQVPVEGVDAIVVALKSRTAPVAEAVADALQAARWLRAQGAAQMYFKVCSTFDSTPAGNIGPVAEALVELLGARIVPVTPAFPENARTVYQGHLFVGEQLLSDSSMRQHPLTPMLDSSLVRVLQAQLDARAGRRVGLVNHAVVAQGASAVRARLSALETQGASFAVLDAIDNGDLLVLAEAVQDAPLLVAGSGLAIGLPRQLGLQPNAQAAQLPAARGARAIVSGSCSVASNAQVAAFKAAGGAAYALDPLRGDGGADLAAQALAWALPRLERGPVLVHATAEPAAVREVQNRLGVQRAGALLEDALAAVAVGLVRAGVGQLIVAGGETSGACAQALGIAQLRIGAQIDPGVPWCYAEPVRLHIALKSGNFGGVDFFMRAFDALSPVRGDGA